MKRIASLVLATLLGLGSASAASAVEFKVKGYHDFAFGLQDNASYGGPKTFKGENFYEENSIDKFIANQRFRTQIDIIASETLKGVLYFEIGDFQWGNDKGGKIGSGSGGGLGADGINIKTRRAYIEWFAPDTNLNFRIGIQGLGLPGIVAGSPVFDDDVAAFVGHYQFNENIGLTAFWARPFDQQENDGFDTNSNDEMDMFGLMAPISVDGFKATPWAVYSRIGQDAGYYDRVTGAKGNRIGTSFTYGNNDDNNNRTSRLAVDGEANAWWVGSAFQVNVLDPFIFKADLMYGSLSVKDSWATTYNDEVGTPTSLSDFKSTGWFIDAAIDYKTAWGVPGIFGWYSSGDKLEDVRDGKLGRIPTMPGTSNNFKPTSFGFDGSQNDVMTDAVVSRTGIGFWGIGAQIKDMSFVEDLKHTLRLTYYGGTNDHKIIRDSELRGHVSPFGLNTNDLYLSTKESVIEVNFDHSYKIYENLLFMVDLGYLHLNLSKDRNNGGDRSVTTSGSPSVTTISRAGDWGSTVDAWKAQVGFRYSF